MANESKIKCTFDGCYEYFTADVKMKKHKKHDHSDEYCHICDIDFEDWETMIAHKSSMSGLDVFRKTQSQYKKEKESGVFWNLKGKFGPDYGNLKHHMYYCKFCGMKWQTSAARDDHTIRQHPIDQNIKCPGCDASFPKAAGMMYHLEEGHCPRITAIQFKGYLQHKGLINRLLEDPTLLYQITEKDVMGYYESARDDDTTGGVSLLDYDNDDITWDEDIMITPDPPKVTPTMPINMQTWPSLPSQQGNSGLASGAITKAMDALSINTNDTPAPWEGEATTKELFPAAKPTKVNDEWAKRLQARDTETRKNNVLVSQFWNPASGDFQKGRFYDPVMERHRCPFPGCEEVFVIDEDCQLHIADDHAITQIRCPSCLKLFRAHHALIAHVENTQKCKIKHHKKFGEALSEFSGGFLKHEIVGHPDLNPDEDGYQIGFIKYESEVPAGFEEGVNSMTVGKKV